MCCAAFKENMVEVVDPLGESQLSFRQILDGMPTGCQIVGFDWRYQYLNAAAEKHNRRPNSELLGRTVMQCWPGITETPVFDLKKLCMKKRTSHSVDTEFVFPDGHRGWFRITIQPATEGIVIFSEDITAQRQAEEERRQFLKFFETSSDLMCIADPNGAFKRTNPAFTEVLGFSEEELVSRPFIDFVHPEDQKETLDEMARQQILGYSFAYENRYLRKDGSFLWLSWHAVYNSEENSTYAIARDITQRKQSDLELKLAIAESQRFRAALDQVSAYVYMKDHHFRYIYANRLTLEMFHRSIEDLGDFDDTDFFSAKAVRRLREIDSVVLQGTQSSREIDVHDSDGRRLVYWEVKTPVYEPDSKSVIGLLGISTDITQRKQMEEEIRTFHSTMEERVRERTAALEEAVRELESFSYSVSHDLRAPLRHINSYSSILIEDFGELLPGESCNYLDRICAASSRMGSLIDHLLELSRMSTTSLQLEAINLSELAAQVLGMLQETTPQRCVKICLGDSVTILGDKHLFRLLMENLLGNAWKYTSQKDKSRIEFGMTEIAGEEVFFVRDDGVGFNMAYQQRLFRPFERLHGSEFEGVGIGLATCQRIIKRHGGKIWAEGKVGEGATFFFTLPVYF